MCAGERHGEYVCDVILPEQDTRPIQRHRVRYPASDTLLAASSKSNIITAQMHRFLELCMRKHIFVQHCGNLMLDMKARGYSHARVTRQVNKFLAARTPTEWGAAAGDTVMRQITRAYHKQGQARMHLALAPENEE